MRRDSKRNIVPVVLVVLIATGGIAAFVHSEVEADIRETSTPEGARGRPRRSASWDDVRSLSARHRSDAFAPRAQEGYAAPLGEARVGFPVPIAEGDAGTEALPRATFAQVRGLWTSEIEDAETTGVIRSHVEQMFTDFGVEARRTEISCTARVCRARVEFETMDALRKLQTIPVDDAAQIQSGPPELSAEGVGVEILWVRDTEETPF